MSGRRNQATGNPAPVSTKPQAPAALSSRRAKSVPADEYGWVCAPDRTGPLFGAQDGCGPGLLLRAFKLQFADPMPAVFDIVGLADQDVAAAAVGGQWAARRRIAHRSRLNDVITAALDSVRGQSEANWPSYTQPGRWKRASGWLA
jgi:hypothetical protein